MRGLSSLPLDDDIIDRILIFLPDYSTLLATLLSSKSFYNVFKAHPNSILRAVSYNVTGPALPQAIRVLRYSPPDPDAQTDPLMAPGPWQETDAVSPITNAECQQLQHNAAVVNTLEDLFSYRHKDRNSQTSVLDSRESWRFRRAMYRAMLFAKAFPPDDYEEDFDDDPDPDELLKARLQRKKLLEELSNYELRELRSATFFLIEVAKWATVADSEYQDDILESGDVALARGPTLVLAAYRIKSVDELIGDLVETDTMRLMLEEYISYPLRVIWEERKEKPPPEDATHWNSVLDSIRGEHDACQKCNKICGFDLWNETSWEYLRGVDNSLTLKGLPNLMKGNLSHSVLEPQALTAKIYQPTFTYTKLLDEIYQIRTPVYDTWAKQHWMCAACITEIIQSHLHLWLLERKRESGEHIAEDCWYGYNCRTQTHSFHHAGRVNHLCEPTR